MFSILPNNNYYFPFACFFFFSLCLLCHGYTKAALFRAARQMIFRAYQLGETLKKTKIAWPRDKTIENAFYDEN